MKHVTSVIFPVIAVLVICGVSTAQAFSVADIIETIPEPQEEKQYIVSGSVTVITTRNCWISNNPEELNWIVEVPGVPTEVYVIDQHAQEEISHMETVYHPA